MRSLLCHYCILIIVLGFTNCKKIIEANGPVTSISETNVYSTDATATSVLTGIYANLSFNDRSFTGNSSVSVLAGLYADELTLFDGVTHLNYIAYYKNALTSNASESYGSEFWSPLYNFIFTCNAAIEGISTSMGLTPKVKNQLLGEALFLRAFFYFYLVNLYGDVPLAIEVDYKINSTLSRSSVNDIYKKIIEDLKDAQMLMSDEYLDATLLKVTPERVRPNKWAAIALLSRVYLYKGDWANAEAQASMIIDNSIKFGLSDLNKVFLNAKLGNKEAIWQLQPVRDGWNTEDSKAFVITSSGPTDPNGYDGNPVYLSTSLLNSFEEGDNRRFGGTWVDSIDVGSKIYYYPFKYKINTLSSGVSEYLTIFRLAEQYLIRSEARINQNNILGSQEDLNKIRKRAGLENTSASDKATLLSQIIHERQVELFTEFGHRWLDIKRMSSVDSFMDIVTSFKGGIWKPYKKLFPVLYSDLLRNTNLEQNQGY